MNPGERDARLRADQDGTLGTLRVTNAELVQPLPPGDDALATLGAARLRWRAAIEDRARQLLLDGSNPDPARALLAALILGEQEPALRETRSAFTRLGLAHVLAISGFHVTLMAAAVLFLLRLGGDGGLIEPAIVAFLVALYLAILPVSPPIWRAGLMLLALLAADAAGRRYDRLALLAWAAVALLLWRPVDLWSVGFQLSFGLVAVLIRFGPLMHARLWGAPLRGTPRSPPETLPARAAAAFKALVTANTLCWITAAPLIAYHTGQLSLAAVVSGVLVVPIIVVLLIVGYTALLAGAVAPGIMPAAGVALDHLAHASLWIVEQLDTPPITSIRVPPISLALTAALTGMALWWVARARRQDPAVWIATTLVAAWLAAELWAAPRLPNAVALRIDTIAVGDGACHLVRAPGGSILWDCGSTTPGVGRVTVPRAVFALGVSTIDAAVVTHPDLDHYNGLLDAAGALRIRTVFLSEAFEARARVRPAGPEAHLLTGLAAAGAAVRTLSAGDSIPLGQDGAVAIRILNPPHGADWPKDNDHSLVGAVVVHTAAGPRSLLLTGDIEARAMDHLASTRPDLHPTILELPHHGSARPAAFDFVRRLNPAVVLQSTGPDRADDVRWNDLRRGRRWHVTAARGAAWAEIRRDGAVRSGSLRGEP
jgi:competence protein ComEC